MITREATIMINRPIEQVFAEMADPTNHPQWDPGLAAARFTPEDPVRVRTKITEIRKFMGRTFKTTIDVIEFEPNARITRKVIEGFASIVGTATFAATPQGTQVTWRWDMQFSRIFILIGPWAATALKRGSQASLLGLKTLLERQVPIVSSTSAG